MKTFLTTILIISSFIVASSKETAQLNDDLARTHTLSIKNNGSTTAATNRLDSKVIVNQVQNYLSEHLVYPEILREYRIAGQLVLEVNFTEDGKIISYSITDSTTKAFNRVVSESITKFVGLTMKKNDYCASSAVKIPIKFSLK